MQLAIDFPWVTVCYHKMLNLPNSVLQLFVCTIFLLRVSTINMKKTHDRILHTRHTIILLYVIMKKKMTKVSKLFYPHCKTNV